MKERDFAKSCVDFWVSKAGCKLAQLVWPPDVISVAERDDLAIGKKHTPKVARRARAFAGILIDLNAWVLGTGGMQHVQRRVSRSVVDTDDFPITTGLGLYAAQRRLEGIDCVVARNDD